MKVSIESHKHLSMSQLGDYSVMKYEVSRIIKKFLCSASKAAVSPSRTASSVMAAMVGQVLKQLDHLLFNGRHVYHGQAVLESGIQALSFESEYLTGFWCHLYFCPPGCL